MQLEETIKINKYAHTLIYLAVALLVTNVLFFIDEGYYNFSWMLKFWNWIIFLIYSFGIFMGQLVADRFMFKSYKGEQKIFYACLTGVPLGTIIVVLVFYALKP